MPTTRAWRNKSNASKMVEGNFPDIAEVDTSSGDEEDEGERNITMSLHQGSSLVLNAKKWHQWKGNRFILHTKCRKIK